MQRVVHRWKCDVCVCARSTGGESIWGGVFKDDKGGLLRKFDRRGVLGMGNSGKNSNGSQFFITFKEQSKLNGKHVAFGQVVAGWEVLDALEAVALPPADDGKPLPFPVVIVGCGVC
jgi:peptidylprolyl isomerase